jgi:prepilin-type N-terminal cleavage/methylation domain-containing protein
MLRKQTGFTLIELLVSLTVTAIVMTGVVTSFSAQNRASLRRDANLEMEENLRIAMANLASALRNAGYGVPTANLNFWITTVSGFTKQPILLANGGSTINIASCTPSAVARLTAAASATQLSMTVTANPLAVGNLIWIGHSEFARVTGAGTTLGIDTNPMMAGQQGLARNHGIQTPICRVDINTYSVVPDPWDSTKTVLRLERYDGASADQKVMATDISAVQVTQPVAGQDRYLLTMTATAKDPYSANYVTRTLTSDVALVN